jgi:hypothetical protein
MRSFWLNAREYHKTNVLSIVPHILESSCEMNIFIGASKLYNQPIYG